MVNEVLVCGHTGSMNRGCEAIVRSTAKILKREQINRITTLTFDSGYDKKAGLDKLVDLKDYPSKSLGIRMESLLRRILFKDWYWGAAFYHQSIFEQLDGRAMSFNIGGDTYCYGEPFLQYAQNKTAMKHNIKNVLWGCSIDEHALSSPMMQEDLNLYHRIIVRESYSEEILRKFIRDQEKIIRACDPAFQLDLQKTDLPEGFLCGNTLGINLSPLVFSNINDLSDIVWKNIFNLIDWILSNTDMTICLIPHVYNIERSLQDYAVLKIAKQHYQNVERVLLIDKELSCTELKYVISKCRFFVGARTHATIAAYSTGVPTIVLSYSIKSRGIAKDLFGTEEDYAIPWKAIKTDEEVLNAFIRSVWDHEEQIRHHLAEILPSYKQSILDAAHTVLNS